MNACQWLIGHSVLRYRESPGSGGAFSPAWRQRWQWPARQHCQTNPSEGRSSVSAEQRENLEAVLRQSAFPAVAARMLLGYKHRPPAGGQGSRFRTPLVTPLGERHMFKEGD